MEKNNEVFEIKRQTRFIVTFPVELFKIPKYVVNRASRPKFIVNEVGAVIWQPMQFRLYDPITPSTTQSILFPIQNRGGIITPDNAAFDIKLELLGPVGDLVEEWKLTGTITAIDFGGLDWESTETDTLNICINFNLQNATLLF